MTAPLPRLQPYRSKPSRNPDMGVLSENPDIDVLSRFPDIVTLPDMEKPQKNGEAFRIYTPASFGAALRHYRKKSGLSQAELAERAGLNRTYLAGLERGSETEQVRRILRLLKQLGVRMTLEEAEW